MLLPIATKPQWPSSGLLKAGRTDRAVKIALMCCLAMGMASIAIKAECSHVCRMSM